MKTLINARRVFLAFCVAMLPAVALQAHDGPHEPIDKPKAIERATKQVDRLVTEGKLDAGWKANAKVETAELKGEGEKQEWQVTFSNAQAAKPAEKTLYVFLTPFGRYVASNFTGK